MIKKRILPITIMELARRIKKIRISKNLTQFDVSDFLEVEQATYSGYETQAGNLRFETIKKIAKALNCSVPFLVDVDSDIYDEAEWLRIKFAME